jgi:hypothetical protein
MQLGEQWYQTPEGVSDDPNEAISTAVFRMLPPEECAQIMAAHAHRWAGGLPSATGAAAPADAIACLKQVLAQVGK